MMATKSLADKGLREAIGTWLRQAMDGSGLNQTTLAQRSGVARETIWRLLHGRTDASEWTLRRLAEAMGRVVPEGVYKERGEPAFSRRTDAPPAPAGWLFGDPAEAEDQFLTFLRNIERTTRAMIGNPDLFSSEENRINQLAVCRAAMRSAELAGRPVPAWLTRIYNEVIGGTFR